MVVSEEGLKEEGKGEEGGGEKCGGGKGLFEESGMVK